MSDPTPDPDPTPLDIDQVQRGLNVVRQRVQWTRNDLADAIRALREQRHEVAAKNRGGAGRADVERTLTELLTELEAKLSGLEQILANFPRVV